MYQAGDYLGAHEDLRDPLIELLNQTITPELSLELYLSSLHSLAKSELENRPTWSSLADWLVRATTAEPSVIRPWWWQNRNPVNFDSDATGRTFEKILLFQISDLYRYRQSKKHPVDYFGSISPTGNMWYNFDPTSYIECALAGISDNRRDDATWENLALFLELGRNYE